MTTKNARYLLGSIITRVIADPDGIARANEDSRQVSDLYPRRSADDEPTRLICSIYGDSFSVEIDDRAGVRHRYRLELTPIED